LDKCFGGRVYLNEKPIHVKSPGQAIKHGIGFVTEDRRNQGLVLGMAVRENCTLVTLKNLQRNGFIRFRQERDIDKDFINLLRIKTPSQETKVATLSGGNQQKVVFAKW
jgi:ribose transport system ATP-binding protein